MKKTTTETNYTIDQEHWLNLKPTKAVRYSNVDLTGMRFNNGSF